MPKMRLDKLLSHLNCGSRKEVQSFIRAGRVAVNGTAERDPAAKVDPDADRVSLDGREQTYRAQRYYMLNKPAGVITASRTAPCWSCSPRACGAACSRSGGSTRTPRACCS